MGDAGNRRRRGTAALIAPWALALCLLGAPCRLSAATNSHIACKVTVISSPDTDGDELTDAAEAWIGTDRLKPDTDDDGMPDGWEVRYRFDPTVSADGPLDADEDGSCNAAEYAAGTYPRDPTSVFRLIAADALPSPDRVVLIWSSVSNRVYKIEVASNDLSNALWTPAEYGIPGQKTGQNSWTGAVPDGAESFFYRVRTKAAK